MATLQKIRNRSVLLLIAIGVALFGFVLTDALTNGSSWSSFAKNYVAKVNGEKLTRQEFDQKEKEVTQLYKNQGYDVDNYKVREESWGQLLQEMILNDQYSKLGITISGDEVLDMYTGQFISPVTRQELGDPQTGLYDRNQVKQILKFINTPESEVDPNQMQTWANYKNMILFLEQRMIAERKQQKYANLLMSTMSTTEFEKNLQAELVANSFNLEYLYVPFSSVKEADIQIKESDIEKYYNANKKKYAVKASRELKYVTFPLVPSTEDHRQVQADIMKIASDFRKVSSSEDDNFVALNSENKAMSYFLTKAEVPQLYMDSVFNYPIGTVFSPKFDKASNIWTITKIHDRRTLPDSVRISVISLAPNNADGSLEVYNKRVDSVLNLVKNSVNLENISELSTNKQKVDFGWMKPGQVIDSCFFGKKNDVFLLQRPNNEVAIIKVTDQAKKSEMVKLSFVTKTVNYSNETQKNIYSQVASFASSATNVSKFDTTAVKEKLYSRTATVQENDYSISELGNCRELIKWANTANVGDISEIQEVNENFVVAYVAKIIDEGYTPLKNVSTAIKIDLLREKRMEQCKSEVESIMKSNKDLSSIATQLKLSVARVSDFSFQNSSLGEMGNEPTIVTAATYAPVDKVLGPIAGNGGVFVIKVISKTKLGNSDLILQQMRANQDMMRKYLLSQQLINILQESSEIVDNRSRFY